MVPTKNSVRPTVRYHLELLYKQFIAADGPLKSIEKRDPIPAHIELIDCHPQTPPTHRGIDTYFDALNRLDDDLLRHRPLDRTRTIRMFTPLEGVGMPLT